MTQKFSGNREGVHLLDRYIDYFFIPLLFIPSYNIRVSPSFGNLNKERSGGGGGILGSPLNESIEETGVEVFSSCLYVGNHCFCNLLEVGFLT